MLNPHFVAGEQGFFGGHKSEDIRTFFLKNEIHYNVNCLVVKSESFIKVEKLLQFIIFSFLTFLASLASLARKSYIVSLSREK